MIKGISEARNSNRNEHHIFVSIISVTAGFSADHKSNL